MGVILSFILASLYAMACVLIGSYSSQRPLTRASFYTVNAVMVCFALLCCVVAVTECQPQTVGGWVTFAVYCLIMSLLYLFLRMVTVNCIIDRDKVYDFKPKGAFNNEDGTKTYVGYIDNGVAQTPVIVNNCKEDLHIISIKVQYLGNCREKPFRVKLYDKEKQKHFLVDFRINVQKVEV